MIEINLSTKGKEQDLTNLGGLNLSLVNVKMLFIGLVLIYTLEPVIDIVFGSEIEFNEKEVVRLRAEHKNKASELRKYDEVKRQVKELDEQQKKLKAKISVVRDIVDMRQNPFNVMKYIAENTPKDVWLIELELNKKKLTLVGYSSSWKSIGDFIENLKSSIFFNGSVSYNKPENLKGEFDKKRVETFQITTEIVSF